MLIKKLNKFIIILLLGLSAWVASSQLALANYTYKITIINNTDYEAWIKNIELNQSLFRLGTAGSVRLDRQLAEHPKGRTTEIASWDRWSPFTGKYENSEVVLGSPDNKKGIIKVTFDPDKPWTSPEKEVIINDNRVTVQISTIPEPISSKTSSGFYKETRYNYVIQITQKKSEPIKPIYRGYSKSSLR